MSECYPGHIPRRHSTCTQATHVQLQGLVNRCTWANAMCQRLTSPAAVPARQVGCAVPEPWAHPKGANKLHGEYPAPPVPHQLTMQGPPKTTLIHTRR